MAELSDNESDPWITYEGSINSPAPLDIDIERMSTPNRQGDVPDPSPVKSRTPKKTDEEKWKEYLEVYDEFNKLKKQYDDKIKQAKKDFIKKKPGASKQEKKDNLVNYKKKMKCLNCKKLGGTIFTDESAKCGAEEPCKLNISLQKPSTIDLPYQIERLTNIINEQKRIITEYKLDLLFGLDDEEVILNEFQQNKDNLETLLSTIVELKEYYDKRNTLVEVPQINPDTGEVISGPFGEKIWVSRKETLDKKQKKLNQLINEFKKNIKAYKKENVLIGKTKILTDSIQIYKNVIVPLQIEIRDLKYQKIDMNVKKTGSSKGKKVPEMPIYHFYPIQFDIENRVIQNNDFEVEEFIK